jgi:membrane fusion protein (multidrug efflux system)
MAQTFNPAPDQKPALPQAGPSRRSLYRNPFVLIVGGVLLVVALGLGVRYYLYATTHESTDDAFIDGNIGPISPRVAGHVLRVAVRDNQQVSNGDLLAELDPRDFNARLAQARASFNEAVSRKNAATLNVEWTRASTSAGVQEATSAVQTARSDLQAAEAQLAATHGKLEQAGAAVSTATANLQQAKALLGAAEADAARLSADLKRYQQLFERDEVSRQQLDQATSAELTAKAQLEAARTRVTAAEAQLAEARAVGQWAGAVLRQAESQVSAEQAKVGEKLGRLAGAQAGSQQVAVSRSEVDTVAADIEEARAALVRAELDLSYTKISAPQAGRVTRKTVVAGAFVQVGQPLMAIVAGDLWVTANFKETQLRQLRVGQQVDIAVDAYPDQRLAGHVDSIQSGTGSRFSMLPPENASGNYIKVVQRVPVKIVFDPPPPSDRLLAPGMSVVPAVKVK